MAKSFANHPRFSSTPATIGGVARCPTLVRSVYSRRFPVKRGQPVPVALEPAGKLMTEPDFDKLGEAYVFLATLTDMDGKSNQTDRYIIILPKNDMIIGPEEAWAKAIEFVREFIGDKEDPLYLYLLKSISRVNDGLVFGANQR